MTIAGINLVGVLLGAVAGFAFGAVYYTLLSKHWLDAIGKSEEDVKDRSAGPFITSFVSLLVLGSVLAWHFDQQGSQEMSALDAIRPAVVLWLGFIVTSMATNNAFQGAKVKLTVLDSAHWLGVLVVQVLVIARF